MKILVVEQYAKDAANYSIDLVNYLSNNNEVVLACPKVIDKYLENKEYGFNIKYLYNNSFQGGILRKVFDYYISTKKLLKYIKKQKFDVVHLQWFSLPWIEYYFVKKIKKYSKLVITCHDVTAFNLRFKEEKYLKKIYYQADAVLVHKDNNKKQFIEKYGFKDNVYSIPDGLFNEKDFVILDKEESKNKLGIPLDKVVFSSIGKYRESKGIDILIKAFGIVSKQYDDAFLLIAGDFSKADKEYYNNLFLENTSKTNSKLMLSYVELDKMPLYYAATDYSVLSYKNIYQSGVMQTSLFYQKALILSNLENFRDGIDGNGYFFESENVDSLVEIMKKAIIEKNNIKEKEENSKKLAHSRFDSLLRVKETEKIYYELCEKGAKY